MENVKFWDRLAKNYDDEVGNETIGITKNHLAKTDTVLDFGCATGAYTIALSGEVKQISGIDISPKMIELAKEKSKDIDFQTASIYDIDKKYDVVLAFNLLHLLENAEKAIDKIDEILNPGGRFISVTACMKEQAVLMIAGFFMKIFGMPYVRKFKITELQDMIAGKFEIIETKNFSRHLAMIVAKK